MAGVGPDEGEDLFGAHRQHLGIVPLHVGPALRVPLTDDDPLGGLEQQALEGTHPGGPGADEEDGVLRPHGGDLGGPVAGGQDVPHEEGLEVAHPLRDGGEALVGQGDPDAGGLSAVDAAAQGPAALGVNAVVDPAMAAEEAVPAEGLHVHRHPVPGLYPGDGGAHRLHHAHHLVAQGDAGHRPGHRAVLDVEVAGADAGEGDPDDGVPVLQQHRLGLFQQPEVAPAHVGIGQHRPTSFPDYSPRPVESRGMALMTGSS